MTGRHDEREKPQGVRGDAQTVEGFEQREKLRALQAT